MITPIDPIKREWMKELRKEKGMKTREIAEIFDISFQHYNDIENGRRNPSIELSLKMAEFFNTPLIHFFEDRTKFKREIKEEYSDEEYEALSLENEHKALKETEN
jgi:putative transcriptional regulator